MVAAKLGRLAQHKRLNLKICHEDHGIMDKKMYIYIFFFFTTDYIQIHFLTVFHFLDF